MPGCVGLISSRGLVLLRSELGNNRVLSLPWSVYLHHQYGEKSTSQGGVVRICPSHNNRRNTRNDVPVWKRT